jgi:hypothetical protein
MTCFEVRHGSGGWRIHAADAVELADAMVDGQWVQCAVSVSALADSQDRWQLDDIADLIAEMILTRAGEVVTRELALERARNIASALRGVNVPSS